MKELFDTLLKGDIVIGVDEKSTQNWHIVRIALMFKPEAFKGLLGG